MVEWDRNFQLQKMSFKFQARGFKNVQKVIFSLALMKIGA